MPILPPLTQTLDGNATGLLATIDEVIARNERLVASIDEVIGAVSRMTEDESAAARAETEVATAVDEAVAAIERQIIAVDDLALAMDRNIAATDANTASIDAMTVSMDAEAASATKAGEATGLFAAHGKMALLAVAGAMVYGVVQAAKFQTEVTRLYTAAGLTHVAYGKLSQQILMIGDATGYSGTKIAEALYHPISAGLSLAAALRTVTYAAQLAQIHGADLEETTYALSSVMKAYGIQASGVAKTSALLNAVVGQGDMRFQDFVQSIKNWTPTGASMGISIQSMGAALAYLTDRGNSAEIASTRLTMGLSMVTSGSKAANEYLSALGLTTGTLSLRNQTLQDIMLKAGLTTSKIAQDLRRPDGIYVALTQLQDAFRKAGLSANEADQVMAKIFGGGRSDKAMLSLMQNLDQLRSKYHSIGGAVKDYGSSWAKTQQTVSFEWHKTLAGLQNLAISFGSVLLPAVLRVLTVIGRLFSYIQANPVLRVLVGIVVSLAVALGVATAAASAFSAAIDANPISLIIMAIAGLIIGLYELWKHCALVRQIVADVGRFFADAWRLAMRAAGAVIAWFTSGPLAWIKAQIAVFAAFWQRNHVEIMRIVRIAWTWVKAQVIANWDIIWGVLKAGFDILVAVVKSAWDIIAATFKIAWTVIKTVVEVGIHTVLGVIQFVLDIIQGHWSAAWRTLENLATYTFAAIGDALKSIGRAIVAMLYQVGKNLIEGLIHGIEDMAGGVVNAVKSVIGGAVSTAKSILGISSPSRVFHGIGADVGAGLAKGITDSTGMVGAAAAGLAASAYASASQAVKAQNARQSAGLSLLTLFGDLSGTAPGTSTIPSQVKSAISKILSMIQSAVSAGNIGYGTGATLTDWVKRDNKRLEGLAVERQGILDQIKKAQKYALTTQQNVVSWAGLANIQSAIPSGGAVTGGTLLAGLQADLAKIKQFNAVITKLHKLGLSKALLNQIIQAGPDNGLQMALAILAGPISQIRQLNQTETQIQQGAKALGQASANAMYDTGKYAGQGFLSGLEHQQKAIERLMERIARGMIRTLRRELGISSPSMVAHWHGLQFALGLARGLDDGQRFIDAAMGRMSGSVSLRPGGLHHAGRGGGDIYVTIKVDVPGGFIGSNPELSAAIAKAVQPALLRLQKQNPVDQLRARQAV